MSTFSIRKEFGEEADRLRRLVAFGAITVKEAKQLMHKLANELVEEEVHLQKIRMATSMRYRIATEEL